MSRKPVMLELVRDGQCTPWGFRMAGGSDIGMPLTIQRVCFGSPSEGELQKEDIILSINNHDARKLSHYKASELIAKAGNNLKLLVLRNTGAAPASPAVSPTPSTPLIAPLLTHQGNTDVFKPLPRTELPNDVGNRYYKDEEKAAIANQAYRTFPLITPNLKTTKDSPTGSYLRFSRDTSGRSTSQNAQNDPYMLSKVQEAILEAALSSPRASISSSRTSTPDISNQNICLKQYNSPINLYSQQAVVETLKSQMIGDASSKILQNNLPRVQSPVDLSKSPTYQLIQEQEWKQGHREHKPVENKVHNLEEILKSGCNETIQQSNSFKALMANLKTPPGQPCSAYEMQL